MRESRVENLTANQPRVVSAGGTIVAFDTITSGATVSLRWLGVQTGRVSPVRFGRKYRPGFRFDSFELTSDIDASVTLLVGDGDADVTLADGQTLISNAGSGQAVPVDVINPAGDPVQCEIVNPLVLTASSVTITTDGVEVADAHPMPVKLVSEGITTNLPVDQVLGDTLTDNAAVAVTAVLTAVLAADAARRSVRLYNQGPDAVALGGAGLTWAKRAVVLQVGDMWPEEIAPGAVINAICDAGNTATLGVQVAS